MTGLDTNILLQVEVLVVENEQEVFSAMLALTGFRLVS